MVKELKYYPFPCNVHKKYYPINAYVSALQDRILEKKAELAGIDPEKQAQIDDLKGQIADLEAQLEEAKYADAESKTADSLDGLSPDSDYKVEGGEAADGATIKAKNVLMKDATVKQKPLKVDVTEDAKIESVTISEGEYTKAGAHCALDVESEGEVTIKDVTISPTKGYNAVEVGKNKAAKTIKIEKVNVTTPMDNNGINIFSVAEGGTVTISDCKLTSSSNPIKITNRKETTFTVNIISCDLGKVTAPEPYLSPILLEDELDASKKAMAKVTINLTNVTVNGQLIKEAVLSGAGRLLTLYNAVTYSCIDYSEENKDQFPTVALKSADEYITDLEAEQKALQDKVDSLDFPDAEEKAIEDANIKDTSKVYKVSGKTDKKTRLVCKEALVRDIEVTGNNLVLDTVEDTTVEKATITGGVYESAGDQHEPLLINAGGNVVIKDATLTPEKGYNGLGVSMTEKGEPMKAAKNVTIDNVHIGTLENNGLNIYQVEEGGVINISNVTIDECSNPIRLSNSNNKTFTINITDCDFKKTDTSEWAGLICCEDTSADEGTANSENRFGPDKMTVKIKNVKVNGQLLTAQDKLGAGTPTCLVYIYRDCTSSILDYDSNTDKFPTVTVE